MMWSKGRKREKAGGGGGGLKITLSPLSLRPFTVLLYYIVLLCTHRVLLSHPLVCDPPKTPPRGKIPPPPPLLRPFPLTPQYYLVHVMLSTLWDWEVHTLLFVTYHEPHTEGSY